LIDPRAIIDSQAQLDSDVQVGPYSIVGPGVQIGAGTRIGPHVVIQGPTRIGRNNRIHAFVSLGGDPQDKKYKGEPDTWLEIGNDNEIREYCTMNRGTLQGGGFTRIGDNNWLMAYTHFAHDCQVGSHTVFANGASIAGHVTVGDYAILGGFAGVHQFCAIGTYSFIAGGTIVFKDVPPFVMASGNPAQAHGLNREGLKRHGFNEDTLRLLRQAYKTIYKKNLTLKAALELLQSQADESSELVTLITFLQNSQRGIVR
jgi:UDP-N-acetylglucosamine acyltransferase